MIKIKKAGLCMVISFFGHRDFCESDAYEKKLLDILEELVGEDVAEFYLGGYGEFDSFAYRCCKQYKKTHPHVKLIYVTPYLSQNDLKEKYERYAYNKNNSYSAVVQRVGDFLNSTPTISLGKVKPTITPKYILGSVEDMLPEYVIDSIREALPKLDKILSGFASPDAILTGIESRSSAPYQVPRDENMQSNILGLFMVGEGAGFAGGIMTSAVDGIKAAHKIIDIYGN